MHIIFFIVITCPHIKAHINCKIVSYKFEVGQFTTLQCDPGNTLKGREQILCRPDAEWNDVTLTYTRL